MTPKINVIITMYNSPVVEQLAESIQEQTYQNFEVILIDDCSDNVEEIHKHFTDPRILITSNEQNMGKAYNLVNVVPDTIEDEDVIMFIDGDDWLYDDDALEIIAGHFSDPNIMVMYGSYIDHPSYTSPSTQNTTYPDEVHEMNAYRRDVWRASHPKCIRGKVWNQIPNEMFEDITFGDDLVMMFEAMERVQQDQIVANPETVYVYNDSAEHIPVDTSLEQVIRMAGPAMPLDPKPVSATVELTGGLGNQMFQAAYLLCYANAYPGLVIPYLTYRHSVPNQGNHISNYKDNMFRSFDFEPDYKDSSLFVPEKITLSSNSTGGTYGTFPPMKFSGKHNYIFKGHFQRSDYFDHECYEALRKAFEWAPGCYDVLPGNNQILGIHIRRGDYSKFPDHHPMLPLEYYQEAMGHYKGKYDRVKIFTDSPEWVKENLNIGDIISRRSSDYQEMSEFSRCGLKIISNSSFSWWGAYLSNKQNVIYPKNWYGPGVTEDYDLSRFLWVGI